MSQYDAWLAFLRGDLQAAPHGELWRTAAHLHATLMDGGVFEPALASIEPSADGSVHALYASFRLALFRQEFDRARELISYARRHSGLHPAHRLAFLLMQASVEVFEGCEPGAHLPSLALSCRRAGFADWFLDAQLLSALTADTKTAAQNARRLMRQASTEGLLDREGLAAVCLARARRLEGRTWLAHRILSIAVIAPGLKRFRDNEGSLSGMAGTRLHTALTSMNQSEEVAAWARELRGTLWELDASVASQLLDFDCAADSQVREWRTGRTARIPRGFRDPTAVDQNFYILLRPESSSVRILPARRLRLEDGELPDSEVRLSARPARALAPVAFAGVDGLRREDWLCMVHGSLGRATERQALTRQLLRRIRGALPAGVELDVTSSRVALRTNAPVIFLDPSGAVGLEERALGYLAWRPDARVSEMAQALAVSRRTVQRVVAELVEHGLCTGSGAEYRVDDTSFSTPTHLRVNVDWKATLGSSVR